MIALRARTIRFRLTALYTAVFLVCGAALLTIGYLLVRRNLEGHHRYYAALARLGLHPVTGTPFGFPAGSTNARLVAVVEHQLVNQSLHTLLVQYVIALVLMTLLSSVIGWLLAGRALAPLRDITATARRVSGENLRERIALQGPADELKELADTFDGMLARLDGAFAGQRHFVASASHELRTPLAIMRTEVDVSLADPDATIADLRSMGEAVRDMVDRCERLIASLLVLARSEAAVTRDEPVDLAELAGDCITDLRVRARDAEVTIDAQLEPAPTSGDSSLLERLIFNLVDNGIRHNVSGGRLTVSTSTRDRHAVLEVANGGERIDPKEAAMLVQPFRRLYRSVDGFGLGLSIVRSVAEAHGGSMRLTAPDDGGLRVLVTLPAPRSEPRAASFGTAPTAEPRALSPGVDVGG
jgi:signal transduction histidine kinase